MRREDIGKYLGMIHRLHIMLIDKKLESHDITHSHFFLLLSVYDNEGITQNDLCELYKIDKGAVSKGIKKLIEENLVVKLKDSEDKRKQLIYVTEKAKKIEKEIKGVLGLVEDDITKEISEEELDAFVDVINKILNNLYAKVKER
ncbi:winged helix-turn-helix transcriptional regulator [Clostridium sp. D2Q-14]|uniref:MarR family winged helix-turn-helix transcriptional regulator n=1 Tax=Anaeromonas gelatinilytica TaxID=2683194 RepID=UPI00193B1F88|nr:MarR family winged helix-turn-helix transcriptional regulator [Anaeromonas gelatinilytica]MBS4534999.1 winged helix-turn-helix transcriptional regulator [Anaeromonas gelatinilytica]